VGFRFVLLARDAVNAVDYQGFGTRVPFLGIIFSLGAEMTRDEASCHNCCAECRKTGYEQGVRDSADLLKNYWSLLQRFYDADKQMLPRWDNGMFEEQEKISKALSLLDAKQKKS
jgi:hypothetical protein